MSSEPGIGRDCSALQELVVWYPTGTLEREERERVEAHLAVCSRCADLLSFAVGLRDSLASAPSHLSAETLVCISENAGGLSERENEQAVAHLAVCARCRNEMEILGRVDADLHTVSNKPAALPGRRGVLVFVQRWIRRRATDWLGPVPAAGYLVAAILLAVVLQNHTARMDDEYSGGAALDGPAVQSITLLPDRWQTLRGGNEQVPTATVLAVDQHHFLLLELTNLSTAPDHEALYRVSLELSDGPRVLEREVPGSAFSDNYTLLLALPPGTLAVGVYEVRVTGPDAASLYHTTLEFR